MTASMTWPEARRAANLDRIDSGSPGYATAFRKALALAGIAPNSPEALRAALGGDSTPQATYAARSAQNLTESNIFRGAVNSQRHEVNIRVGNTNGVTKAGPLTWTSSNYGSFGDILRRLLHASDNSVPTNSQPQVWPLNATLNPARRTADVSKSVPIRKTMPASACTEHQTAQPACDRSAVVKAAEIMDMIEDARRRYPHLAAKLDEFQRQLDEVMALRFDPAGK